MNKDRLERILVWVIRIGVCILPFLLLFISTTLFFPFITGKNFLFRIIVEIMGGAWIMLLFIDVKKYLPKSNPIVMSLIFFVFVAFLASLFGTDFKHSFWSNFERMEGVIAYLHLLLLFFVITGTFKTKKEWFILFGLSIISSVMVAFYGLLESMGIAGQNPYITNRIISTLGNPLYVAVYLTFNIFLAAYLWLSIKDKSIRFFLTVALFFEFFVLLLTGSRGAFISMIISILIILLFLLFRVASPKKRIFFAVLMILLLLIPTCLYLMRDSELVRNSVVLKRFSKISLTGTTMQARFTVWKIAFESFKQKPVLGWGMGNFIIPFAKNYDVKMFGREPWFDRTHNMPFEMLMSTGIIGFSAYVMLFISIMWGIKKALKKKLISENVAIIFLAMLVAYLVQMLFVFDILATHLMLIIFMSFFSFLGFVVEKSSWDSEKVFEDESPVPSPKVVEEKQSGNYIFKLLIISFLVVVSIIFINIRPLVASSSLIKAFTDIRKGHYSQAEEQFRKALNLTQSTVGLEEVREHLAFNILMASRSIDAFENQDLERMFELAIAEMEKQVEINPKDYLKVRHNIILTQLYERMGVAQQDITYLNKAYEEYKKLIEYTPNYIGFYPLMSNFLASTGKLNDAMAVIDRGISLLPESGDYDPDIFYSRALIFLLKDDYDEAYKIMQGISAFNKLDPQHMLKESSLQNILNVANRKNDANAFDFLEKIYELDPARISTTILLMQKYASINNLDRARFFAQKTIDIDPSRKEGIEDFLNSLSN